MTHRDDEREAAPHDRPGSNQTPDDDSLLSADAEVVGEVIGRELSRDADAPAWKDERYLQWRRDELRDRDPRARRLTDEEFIARGRELMARAQATRLGLVRRDHALVVREGPRSYEGESIQDVTSARSRARAADVAPFVDLGIAAGDGRELWDEPVEQWVTVPDDVPDGRYLAMRIVGDSMAPLMTSGDRVLVRLGAEVERETVIVARHPDDGYVCKRVAKVSRDRIELASLAPGRAPITIPRRTDLIVGTVVMVSRGHASA